MDVVDVIGRLARAVEHTLHRDLGIARPLPGGPALGVVEDQLDTRARHRLARGRAVEDHVLHRLAAQRGRARLAQHPAHGVDDVRLAAAVGPDHADEVAGGEHGGGIDEGLETGEFELGETHSGQWEDGGTCRPANQPAAPRVCGRHDTTAPKASRASASHRNVTWHSQARAPRRANPCPHTPRGLPTGAATIRRYTLRPRPLPAKEPAYP